MTVSIFQFFVVPNGIAFEVVVQPYHMLEYCHGVVSVGVYATFFTY